MRHDIKIIYDGKYPCLCMGHLIVIVDGVEYDFGSSCLLSGGCINFDDGEFDIEEGDWDVEYPKDFPDELKEEVLDSINENIPWGCCGGCI